jgi:hypothetical protein
MRIAKTTSWLPFTRRLSSRKKAAHAFLRIAIQWDDLSDDPRFQAIARRINFPS